MARLCPVCGSSDTGGYPKHHKTYTERGRLDIDDWYCPTCESRWEIYEYIREDVTEVKNIRLKDGRPWVNGEAQGTPITCRFCMSEAVTLVSDDGPWRTPDVRQLRYECGGCGAIWVNMRHTDGTVKMWRLWRQGRAVR